MKFTFSFLALAMATLSSAQDLMPCKLSQLAGDSEIFTITGGNSTFSPNSTQAVIYDRPSGAPVRRILANVTIVDLDNDSTFTPSDVTGLPVVFSDEERPLHLAGGIGITLPETIPEGDNYVFRVTIRSRGFLCYLDSNTFIVDDNLGGPVDGCTPGAMMCTDNDEGFQQCIETNANATAFEFGPIIDCAATTSCNQVNNFTISCIPPVDPVDECELGATECVDADSSRTCIQGTNGTVWSEPESCEAEFSCNEESGVCEADDVVEDECTLGETECVTETSSRTCVEDVNGRAVWGPSVECTEGFSCNNETGVCENVPVDECTVGQTECVTESSNRVCVEDGETGTGVWSDPADCAAGTTCDEETGLCTFGTPGDESCMPNSQVCLSETEFDTCVQGDDGFWNFGGVTSNCPDDTTCTPYMNNTINCVPNTVNATVTVDNLVRRTLFRFRRA